MRENLRWRSKVHRKVLEDPEYAEVIREACSKDFLFWLAGFGWTYDPRPHQPFPRMPFIPYPFQEKAAIEILFVMGTKDLLVEKSRDMGASYLLVAIYTWLWLYHRDLSFLFVSRVEDYVDKTGNPKALFWKFDYLVDNLPVWLQPRGYNRDKHRHSMHAENPETGSVIDGESTNKRVARGDRRTSIMLDEFAAVEHGHSVLSATRDATDCRIFNSTPEGNSNAFADIRKTGIKKLRLHWTVHPLKSVGSYTRENGEYVSLDDAYWDKGDVSRDLFDEMAALDRKVLDRGVPLPDGKTRSPWYAEQCSRAGSAQEIAQEVDIDYLGSGYQFFQQDRIAEAVRKYARPPIVVGDLEYDNETAEPIKFVENPKGSLRLWFMLGSDDNPPNEHKISLGCDISAGTGASNSVASGWDSLTSEKIAEYVNPNIRPEQFAKQCVALARWLGGAYLIWETNGVGCQFGSRVMELYYGNIYYNKREEAISKKVSDIPGWVPTKNSKVTLLGAYRDGLDNDKCINRSKEALEETLEFVFNPDGSVVHSKASDKRDPSGAKSNHGDRVIADALGFKGIGERSHKTESASKRGVPVGSLAWRNQMRGDMLLERMGYNSPNHELNSAWR